MSQSTRRLGAVAVLGVVLLGVLLLAGCAGGAAPAPAPTADTAPTRAPTEPPAPTQAPTEPPAPTATLAPTDTPEPEPTATEAPSPTAVVVADATNCVTCHTDQAALQALAVEQEVSEELSEGEG